MRFKPFMLGALSLSLLALTGCDGLFTAPMPSDDAQGTSGETLAISAPTMLVMNALGKTLDAVDLATLKVTPSVMKTGLYPNQLLQHGAVTYLLNSGDHNLVKFDSLRLKVLDTFDLENGSNPMTLHVIEGDKALVVNYLSADVAFVDLSTKQIEATLQLERGNPGGGVAIAAGKAYVAAVEASYGGPEVNYAPHYTFSGVYVIDLATRKVVTSLAFDEADANPLNVSASPDGQIVVGVKNGLAFIDPATDTLVGALDFGEQVGSVQYRSATKAYGAINAGLVAFNPSTREILRGADEAIAVADAGTFKIRGNAAYVTNFSKDTVTIVDLATEAASGSPIPVGDGPQDLVFVEP